MLFEPMFFVAGGATLALALLDKTLSDYGFYGLSTTLKILVPLAGLAAGVYFLETNAILGWLR